MWFRNAIICALLAISGIAPSVRAQSVDDIVQLSVINGWRQVDGSYMTALKLSMRPGWKTYWRVPGEGGIPPQFDWSGSENVQSVRIHWPVPVVFEANGMQSIGYKDELVLPLEIKPATISAPTSLSAEISLGVCDDICVPVNLTVSAALPEQGQIKDKQILSALASQPRSAADMSIGVVKCDLAPISDGMNITAAINMRPLGADEVAVFELPNAEIWVSPSSNRREGGVLTASADLVPPNAQPFALSRSDVRITVLAGGQAVAIEGCTG